MVARRHDIHAQTENRVRDVTGDAKASGGILDVGDHKVDLLTLDNRGEGALGDFAA
jgi:hypothetical protein